MYITTHNHPFRLLYFESIQVYFFYFGREMLREIKKVCQIKDAGLAGGLSKN